MAIFCNFCVQNGQNVLFSISPKKMRSPPKKRTIILKEDIWSPCHCQVAASRIMFKPVRYRIIRSHSKLCHASCRDRRSSNGVISTIIEYRVVHWYSNWDLVAWRGPATWRGFQKFDKSTAEHNRNHRKINEAGLSFISPSSSSSSPRAIVLSASAAV